MKDWKTLLVFVSMLVLMALSSQADEADWAPPLNLFETTGRASEAEIVADPYGTIHIFWAYGAPGAEDSGAGQAIYYVRRQGDSWSEPADVLVSPGNRVARMHSVAADRRGYLHIVWSGGDSIFYSQAHVLEAGSARGWIAPFAFVSGVSALEPCIAVDDGGGLYAVWTQARAGLMFARSVDGGRTWSDPRVCFAANSDTELARWGRIAVDAKGRLHVVWTYTLRVEDKSAPRPDPNYLYYMRSEDRGETWTEPWRVVPEPDFGEINVITFGEDIVHLAWNGRAGRGGRYHRWSADGGKSWSEIVEIVNPKDPIGTGGLTGFPAMAVDAAGVLHLVSATGGGDYHFAWSGGRWSEPTLISPGLTGMGVTFTSSSLEQPSLAVSKGNHLHVVFHDGFQRIWYTSRLLDAPYEPPEPLPASIRPSLTAPAAVPASSSVPTVAVQLTWETKKPLETRAAAEVIVWSMLPVVLLVSLVIVMYKTRRRQ